MCLSAAFRFAAGQKSISADDLVVFAEMFYKVCKKLSESWQVKEDVPKKFNQT